MIAIEYAIISPPFVALPRVLGLSAAHLAVCHDSCHPLSNKSGISLAQFLFKHRHLVVVGEAHF